MRSLVVYAGCALFALLVAAMFVMLGVSACESAKWGRDAECNARCQLDRSQLMLHHAHERQLACIHARGEWHNGQCRVCKAGGP